MGKRDESTNENRVPPVEPLEDGQRAMFEGLAREEQARKLKQRVDRTRGDEKRRKEGAG